MVALKYLAAQGSSYPQEVVVHPHLVVGVHSHLVSVMMAAVVVILFQIVKFFYSFLDDKTKLWCCSCGC
eukprot:m.7136 g.7136  ORF g.7136 m.7136 type:complete len:69 (+) comp5660_c0_seq1:3799-4005(+)